MLVDDQDIDSVIAELDFHQSDDSPHVTARHAAGAPAAHWIHSSTQQPELVNSNRLRGIATDGNIGGGSYYCCDFDQHVAHGKRE